ncbi:nucleotidyl transferase AbiEii/AbiGii toxin family protein [Photobacterium sp. WH77]|uniref:Nucleotidyl transferase AbiEii/AbiGii toxin family protein n=1 Tax=Photobacterium arenosum TaxID=2774143 RepID=A0ABR9BK96_9GAMM|nr:MULTISPECIES: nucleotidyl transferase AbiEii/AbiGii toxin family protein [Photobacterium]MBD8512090.1 nucleotidyl transferase AbiEii/AbiGii toxin family protein [Photobacterium arenosum]MBV7261723.1 nucleotidyl transferase AbiEii/AbiGii toxin family protein [Photobacterium sp. WH24]MCG2836102.1 nucleotidyl transferase AbiEii/AbiGii toxin family protein [Photobacterium sp. WH77]MCG2843761.1 nucleotidyl transferase AbiEii/AbiGii toxin family protein [Photobacterium sp. WH80]
MNDIYELKYSLNNDFLKALSTVVKAADALSIPYFIAGATARDIVLHGIFGHTPGRATRDIDTAIFVDSWSQYEEMRGKLIASGLIATDIAHRLTEPQSGLPVDILPFGTLEDSERRIQWPPKHVETMSVVGFSEAYESSIQVKYDDLLFHVASLPGIALMKLIAWWERGNENPKDASDFYLLLSKYQLIHIDRMWEDYIPSDLGYKVEFVTAFLLGFDMRDILKEKSKEILIDIRDNHQDGLITAMSKGNHGIDIDGLEIELKAFWRGLL